MGRPVILFGNGLSRAADPDYFQLSKAIAKAWGSAWQLTEDDKQAILACLPEHPDTKNLSEGHLETLHEVSSLCRSLTAVSKNPSLFLTTEAQRFPKSVDKFITDVARYFHQHECSHDARLLKFGKTFADFLKIRTSHVATLNYDNVLYNLLIENKVLDGINGSLVDGFTRSGKTDLTFAEENLYRFDDKWAVYLHLHGTPLFLTKNGEVIKQEQNGVIFVGLEPHIVLHHVNRKKGIIASSSILSAYWLKFQRIIQATDLLVVFGYGGEDIHINELISRRAQEPSFGKFRVLVVERSAEGNYGERLDWWTNKLNLRGSQVSLTQKNNVLEFNFQAELSVARKVS